MVTVQEATAIILQNCFSPKQVSVPVTEAVGRVLAEKILADRDFPPFNRVAMDGISIGYEQWTKGQREFLIEDIQAAGQAEKSLKDKINAVEVMTGAVLPLGTDTVIRYEDLQITDGRAKVLVENIVMNQNVHRKGQDAKQADVLVEPGTILSPAEVALLATVGKSHVVVLDFPKAAIVASGDELVSIEDKPAPHQIRRSNTYAIQAAMRKLGWLGTQYHLPDDEETLLKSLRSILAEYDVIILSGGVSKGKFDYIPMVLDAIGVKQLFHEVSQRPGKPFWFGASDKKKVVFALPGNPVSTFMCFHKFVKPWFLKSLGILEPIQPAFLGADFKFDPKLTYFLQVEIKNEEGRIVAYPKAGGGSGDFANLKEVNGFLELPLEKSDFRKGEVYPFIPFR